MGELIYLNEEKFTVNLSKFYSLRKHMSETLLADLHMDRIAGLGGSCFRMSEICAISRPKSIVSQEM